MLEHRTTPAMLAALSVMNPTGAVMSSYDIARRRWPDHVCWEMPKHVRPSDVVAGLARTLTRLCDNFHLFEVRKGDYIVTYQGCYAAGLKPWFERNHHLGDFFDVAVDVVADVPEEDRALAALECLHFWALKHGADLPDITRAKKIAGRAVEVLCRSPLLKRGRGTSNLTGRAILHLAEALERPALRGLGKKGTNRWLLQPLVEATQRKGVQYAARVMVGGAIDLCAGPDDYNYILGQIGLSGWKELANGIINESGTHTRKLLDRKGWGSTWSLPRHEL